LLRFDLPGLDEGVRVQCVFSTRRGGASAAPFNEGNLSFDVGDEPEHVTVNRDALAAQTGLSQFAELKQVHGEVLVLDAPATPLSVFRTTAASTEADALSTATPGLGLCIKTADCQPILLAHRQGRFVAALHAGWRGNVLNLPGSAVERLCAHYGANPADLIAVRGPSLGPDKAQFTRFEAEFGPAFGPYYDAASQTVDLWRLTRHQLTQAGLAPGNIHSLDLCTQTDQERFFSYRAAPAPSRRTGRQMSLIWLA
jgi:hypothetical protein